MPLQKTLRAIALTTLFLIPLFALIVVDAFYFPFITGKAFYFRILVEIAFASWVTLAFLDPRYRPRWTPLTITVTVFVVVALAADLLGVNPIRSLMSNFERMEGWLVVAHLWAFYMSALHIFGSDDSGRRLWHRWFNTSLVVSLIVTIYALVQMFGWAEIHQGSSRLDASLGNAAYLAVYLLMHVGIAAYLFRTVTLKMWRHIASVVSMALAIICFAVPMFSPPAQAIVGLLFAAAAIGLSPYLAFVLLSSFVIFETQTRGTVIGLALAVATACATYPLFVTGINWKKILVILSYPFLVGLYVFFVLILGLFSLSLWWLYWIGVVYLIALAVYVFVSRQQPSVVSVRRGRWAGVIVLAAAFVVTGIFFAIKDAAFIKNSPSLNRIASISLDDTKTQARAYIWPMALKGFTERPILGWGQENFNYIFNANYNPKMWNQEQWFDRAHSVYLDWLVASGAVGLIVYLSLYVLLMVSIWKSSLAISSKSVLTGLVVGYAVHNIFVFDNLASYLFFFSILAFVGTIRITSKTTGRIFSTDAVEYVVLPISILALVAGLYWLNIRPIQANTRLITALAVCTQQGSMPDPNLFVRALSISATANQEAREQIVSCAGSVFSRSYPGTVKQGFYDLLSRAIQEQTTYAPNDARMYVLAGSVLNTIRPSEALPLLERAHELTPHKQSVSMQLAGAYLNTGRPEEAITLLKEAYESDTTNQEARMAYVVGLVFTGKDDQARAVASTSEAFESERVANAYIALKRYDAAAAIYKKMISRDPKGIPLRLSLAQVYVTANMKWLAKDVVRGIAVDYPEYKEQVEALIKQIDEAKVEDLK